MRAVKPSRRVRNLLIAILLLMVASASFLALEGKTWIRKPGEDVHFLPLSKWGFGELDLDGPHLVVIYKKYGFFEITSQYPR